MFSCTIVDQHGEEVRTTWASDPAMLPAQCGPGESAILDPMPSAPAWWDFEAMVWTLRPPAPSPAHQWDPRTKVWVDPRTLEDLKAARWDAIKAARTAAEATPFEWDGSVFDADVSRINGAVTAALVAQSMAVPYWVDWTLADNSVRTLSGPQVIQLGLALATRVVEIHERSQALRGLLTQASTAEQVEAVQW